MIEEPPGLAPDEVATAVRDGWGLDVRSAEHLQVGAGGWHWRLDGDDGLRWFATVDQVGDTGERRALLAAYDAASQLAGLLPFVVAPVRARDGRTGIELSPGLVLSVAPWLEGTAGDAPFTDDAARVPVAGLLGELHARQRPRHLPLWRPTIGWHSDAGREHLELAMATSGWSGGPWSGPGERLLAEARPVVLRAVRRFALLGAAVVGGMDRWVVTHGEPHPANVVTTADGPCLVDWGSVRLAPRERDLRDVLGGADGDDPWYAYVEAGGRPESLSPDTVELFALEWHLSEVAESVVLLTRPHEDSADAERSFGDLEAEVTALVTRWG